MNLRHRRLAMAFGFAFAALPALAQDATTVVATVNGEQITLGHLAMMHQQLPPQYQQLPGEMLFKGLLDQAIQQVALAAEGAALVTRRDELALENDRRAYLAGLVLQDAVRQAITDEALQAAYDAKYKGVEPGLEYNAAHILVASEDEAKALKQQIDDGADFAELARQHSTDGAAQGGGDLGWFGKGMMVKPFEEAVVAMQPGTVAGPVQTQFGWHLINLKETRAASAPGLDDVRDELAAEIEQAVVQARIKAATDGVAVTRQDEGIDPEILKSETLFAD